MLKPYKELTNAQKKQVAVMYSDLTGQEQYLYNFDDNGKYIGRQYAPPSGKTESGVPFGTIHAEPVEESRPAEVEPEEVEEPAKSKRKPRAKK